jgi:indolepyruvate ferredoxin oxidoreductase
MAIASDFSLDDKYTREEGAVILSGAQALVRVTFDQHRADKGRGLNTATLVSGYPGSPLGGLGTMFQANGQLMAQHNVRIIPGVNEDLGATAIFGSQMTSLYPNPKYDGVLGMWYGKGPGVDRTGDIFKHANLAGIGPNGGVLAVAGDDPTAKSSTITSHSESAFYDALIPVLYPGNVQEILDFGRYGFELSRYSGLWVGLKIATNVADEVSCVYVSPDRVQIVDPGFTFNGAAWRPTQNPLLVAPFTIELEREVYYGRLEAAKAFAHANKLNRMTVPTPDAWLGIAAAGKTYYDVREALHSLGLDDEALARNGIRLLKIGMLFPLETGIVREFAQGLEELLVVEEKRGLLELFIRDALYNQPQHPRVIGKRDEQERPLVPSQAELDADTIAGILAERLAPRVPLASLVERTTLLQQLHARPVPTIAAPRQAYFCSGCPHNRSTVVPEGSIAGGGIGCHGMVLTMDRHTMGITHMGGEGVQWVGIAPFSNMPHMFQNLGDGTLFHSGSLAIRQAVSAGTNITYKILYNSTIAMTGGQDSAGAIPVPDLTRALDAEGVKRIFVLTDEPEKYDSHARWGNGVTVWHRDRLDEAQRLLRDTPGVTALIYDQRCAAEKRRMRKRGKLADPAMRVVINEAVCEGCGDCGVKSNCLSVHPVETEFGRKTQIHQSSCNKDYSCIQGDCPSFLTVVPMGEPKKKERKRHTVDIELPEPARRVKGACNVYMTGIGGTGVVTVNQVLATAALLDGKYARGLDQTGLSQKGGPVLSHLKISDRPHDVSNKVAAGEADCYLGFDILVAAQGQNLERAHPERTIAVISTSKVPTGKMVASPDVRFPDADALYTAIDGVTRKDANVYLDTLGLAEGLFGDHMAANMIVLGAAYQTGAIPVNASAIEQAIRLNGVAVDMNLNAFRTGRQYVVDPDSVKSMSATRPSTAAAPATLSDKVRELVDSTGATGELRRLLEIRVPELIAYHNARYARTYVDYVKRVREAEQRAVPGSTRLSEAVARYLFKLMAYKDEYEVARLHLKGNLRGKLAEQYPDGVRLYYHVHPTFLRALGRKDKLQLGEWFGVFFRLLAAGRWLRGTPLDPFGYAEVRRVERAMIDEYRGLIDRSLANLGPQNHDRAVQLASLPDLIRGYETIKLRNVQRFREQAKALAF